MKTEIKRIKIAIESENPSAFWAELDRLHRFGYSHSIQSNADWGTYIELYEPNGTYNRYGRENKDVVFRDAIPDWFQDEEVPCYCVHRGEGGEGWLNLFWTEEAAREYGNRTWENMGARKRKKYQEDNFGFCCLILSEISASVDDDYYELTDKYFAQSCGTELYNWAN